MPQDTVGRAVGDVATPDWFAVTRLTGEDKPGSLGPQVTEYCSHPATTTFASIKTSLRLPVKEPPQVTDDAVTQWANVDDFGADQRVIAIQRLRSKGR